MLILWCCASAKTRSCAVLAIASSRSPTSDGVLMAVMAGLRRLLRRLKKVRSWPTLAIGNYIDRTQEISPWGSCTENWLHRARFDQKKPPFAFTKPIALTPSHCALSMLFTDWNRSGTPSACACRMTVNIMKVARSRCGSSPPVNRQRSTPTRTAGSACASGAWALPVQT